MAPLKVAARFVAFACYLNDERNQPSSPEQAGQYARSHGTSFLLYIYEALGTFLAAPASLDARTCHPTPRTGRMARRQLAVLC